MLHKGTASLAQFLYLHFCVKGTTYLPFIRCLCALKGYQDQGSHCLFTHDCGVKGTLYLPFIFYCLCTL